METRTVILSPEQYTQVSTYDLLCAAEQGFVGIDHRFLHALVDEPEKAIPDLVRFGLENRQYRVESFGEHLIQIFRQFRTPRAIPFLIELFRRSHFEMNIPLICAFQEIGEPAVEPLLEVYKATGFEQDSDAGFLLAGLGVRDPRILDVLIERLKFDAVDAGHCLAAYGDPAAIPVVREAIDQSEEEWVARSLEFCLEELEEGPAPREDEPFDLWGMYPEKAWPRFDLLAPEESELFLDSSDADYRFAALDALYEDKIPSRLWDRLLQMAREDPDARVRGKCWQSLIDGWERPDIQQAMRACLADETASGEERLGALLSLAGREGGKPDIQRRILEFYERHEFRASALEAMINTQDPRFGQYFRQHLGDPDRDTCVKAMLGIGLMEMESDASRLVPYFKDEELRLDALPAYALCAASEPTRAGFRRLYKKIEQLAGRLSGEEQDAVKEALNTRAYRNDLQPVFGDQGEIVNDEPVIAAPKIGRNDPCPCGSGKKYKKCCGG